MPKAPRSSDENAAASGLIARQKRSCIRCNERKIKCDKANPCGACVKSGDHCVFPPPQRAPRTLNRPPVSELLARLRELETEVEQLRSGRGAISNEDVPLQPTNIQNSIGAGASTEYIVSPDGAPEAQEDQAMSENSSNLDLIYPSPSGFFDFPPSKKAWSRTTFHHDYLQPSQISNLWKLYQAQVAPVIALLHRPYLSRIFSNVSNGSGLEPHDEALFLSVCFAAIVSTPPDRCQSEIGRGYKSARQNFEIAVTDAFNKAKVTTSQNMTTLQAAVLYLLSSRLDGDSRRIWAESAILIRVAQSQKMHRDGQKLGFSPFECESRRRLWWHICILDMLVSEDQDVPRQIHPNTFDTQVPTNIDDDDLTPDMKEIPTEQNNFTNITLCIITAHFITELYWLQGLVDGNLTMPFEQRKEIVGTLGKEVEQLYLRQFDLKVPIQWMTATIARLHLSRAWLFIHLAPSSEGPKTPNSTLNDLLFRTGVEVLEFVNLLQTNTTITNWSWLWKSYREWHVMAYVLSEICDRPLDADSDHAWDMVTKMYTQWQGEATTMDSEMAKPLARLMERAIESRANKMANVASSPYIPPGMESSTLDSFPESSSGFDWVHGTFGSK